MQPRVATQGHPDLSRLLGLDPSDVVVRTSYVVLVTCLTFVTFATLKRGAADIPAYPPYSFFTFSWNAAWRVCIRTIFSSCDPPPWKSFAHSSWSSCDHVSTCF